MFPKSSDMFAWYGRRFIFYDTTLQEQNQRRFYKDEIYPTRVFYNKYYMSFFVVTKYDIRVMDAKTGIFSKVLDQIVDHENGFEIIDFDFDDTHRKFYIADTSVILRLLTL